MLEVSGKSDGGGALFFSLLGDIKGHLGWGAQATVRVRCVGCVLTGLYEYLNESLVYHGFVAHAILPVGHNKDRTRPVEHSWR